MQTTSEKGRAELAAHEGIVLSPYRDSTGVWTVFIGHTANAGLPDPASLPKGKEQSLKMALEVFERDLSKFEARVRKAFKKPLSQTQFDAAVSFDYNTGAIHRASWVDRFNKGKNSAAKQAFMWWSKPKEIVKRRKRERDLFFNGTYSGNGIATAYPADAKGRVKWSKGRTVNVLDLMAKPTDEKQPLMFRLRISGHPEQVFEVSATAEITMEIFDGQH